MYSVPVAGAWWHAVDAPLDRGVSRRCWWDARRLDFGDRADSEFCRKAVAKLDLPTRLMVFVFQPPRCEHEGTTTANPAAAQRTDYLTATCFEHHRRIPRSAVVVRGPWFQLALATMRLRRGGLAFAGRSDPRANCADFACRTDAVTACETCGCRLERWENWHVALRRLTFEVTGARRQDALARLAKMYRVPPTGPRWLAVARPVDRGVMPHGVS